MIKYAYLTCNKDWHSLNRWLDLRITWKFLFHGVSLEISSSKNVLRYTDSY